MKMFYVIGLAFTACVAVAGCQHTLHADSSVLNGPVPRCRVLLSDERALYREQAKKECEIAQTEQARKESGGCAIMDYMRFCSPAVISGYGLENPVETIE